MTEERSFEALPGEIARFVAFAMGKGGAGKVPFEKVDVRVSTNSPGVPWRIDSDHASPDETKAVRLTWRGVVGTPAGFAGFAFGVTEPGRLFDHIALLAPDVPVRVIYDEGQNRLRIVQGTREARVPTGPLESVPKPAKDNAWGIARDGSWVSSNPTLRPPDGSSWLDWTGRGYYVASIPTTVLGQLLASAGTLYSHGLRGTLLRFHLDADGIGVGCSDPKHPTSETIDFGRLSDVVVETGSPSDEFSVQYLAVESLWTSLVSTRATRVLLVRHPTEKRLTFTAVERAEAPDGEPADATPPILSLAQAIARWSDPRERKAAKAA